MTSINSVKLDIQPNFKILPPKVETKEEKVRNESISSKEVAKVALGIFVVATPLYLLTKIAFAGENFTQILNNDPSRAGDLISDCMFPDRLLADQDNEFNRNFIKNGDCLSIVNENLKKIVEKIPDSTPSLALHCSDKEFTKKFKSSEEKLACQSIQGNIVPFLMESAPEMGTASAHWCTRFRNPHCMPAIQKYLPKMIELNPMEASNTVSRCFDFPNAPALKSPICESIIKDAFPLLLAKDIKATVDLSSRCIISGDPKCKSLLKNYVPEILKQSPQGAHSLAAECRKVKGDPICNDIIKFVFPS